MTKVVLITGASRGIGKRLVAQYLARPDTTVIAAVRDTTSASAEQLETLPKSKDGSRLIVIRLAADDAHGAREAASEIQKQNGLDHIDIVIANAGICDHWGPVLEAAEEEVRSHLEVNILGPLRLLQAMAPLLRNASAPKFIYISTLLASIGGIGQMYTLTGPYGMSKAAGNYLVRKAHAENEHLVTLSIDPGLVQTDLGNRAAQYYGLHKAPVTLEDSVRGIMTQIDTATKSTTSGMFVNTSGENVCW
ncbi:SDR family oxidoreductase [Aspergillus fijiensis CBS 313.89]|uniref:Toxin biosynthesis ketoreductase n=1 Tax=Aspergillus fijiensis CBS 313.89 TaxID=1448319 RepID=A0A8G1VZZ8_9EURO|nr:toxin biosynthesis ketoreductase [Aspergillus fijiensis CBS 313.89]RAK78078.1 toxin biosynthesis ketoreductase [Aspergillus fijiensis CBS 313.89]